MSSAISSDVHIHIRPSDVRAALRSDVASGLTASPKELPPKWFYDERGSQLFDEITRLPEYYPTEAEREILRREAGSIVARVDADTIVELGSGTSDKTLALLDAARAHGRLERFIPFDVSEEYLTASVDQIARRYPGLGVQGVVGDFDHHLRSIPNGGRRLIVMLGSTIGNYDSTDRKMLLAEITAGLRPGDHLLLGTDLVKAVDRLELAYNDPRGVTADFNKNVLTAINRELGAEFELSKFQHLARFDDYHDRIEMFLRSTCDQIVRIDDLDIEVPFRRGELMRTEMSAKFRRRGLEAELGAVGLEVVDWWTDSNTDFGVSLSVLI